MSFVLVALSETKVAWLAAYLIGKVVTLLLLIEDVDLNGKGIVALISGGDASVGQSIFRLSLLLVTWTSTVSSPHHCWPVCCDVIHIWPPESAKNVGFASSETIESPPTYEDVNCNLSPETWG
jgi:hypothetical protein